MARDTDEELFDRLAVTLRGAEEPPRYVLELAKASFGLHRLDAELAELVADSAREVTAASTPQDRRPHPQVTAASCSRRPRRWNRKPKDSPWKTITTADAMPTSAFSRAASLPRSSSWQLH